MAYKRCERCHIRKQTGRWRGKKVCTNCYEVLVRNKKWTEAPKRRR